MKEINYNNINKHLANVFKYHRKKNNYTQEQVAELSNLSSKYISQLERGISGGTLETILKLCNIYKISPNSILEPFLDKNILEKSTKISYDFEKLCIKDQEAIIKLIEHFIENS